MNWFLYMVGIVLVAVGFTVESFHASIFACALLAFAMGAILGALDRMNTTLDVVSILLSRIVHDRDTGGESK